jgi:YD repeat-containing protein
VGLEYDADGNPVAMSDGIGESTFDYDQLGRLARSEDGHGDVVEYSYDLGEQQTGIVSLVSTPIPKAPCSICAPGSTAPRRGNS